MEAPRRRSAEAAARTSEERGDNESSPCSVEQDRKPIFLRGIRRESKPIFLRGIRKESCLCLVGLWFVVVVAFCFPGDNWACCWAKATGSAGPRAEPDIPVPVGVSSSSAGGKASSSGQNVGRTLQADEMEEYKGDFAEFDTNGDGLIDAYELRKAFEQDKVEAQELYQFFMEVDTDHSGTVTEEEYLDYAVSFT